MRPLTTLISGVLAVGLVVTEARAQVHHIVRQGDTVTGLSQEYYGNTKLTVLLRAVNRMPQEGEVELAIGEPLLIPESARRIVQENDTWQALAEEELGTGERAWFLAEVNESQEGSEPSKGQIISVPYMMPWSLTEGLAATITTFYPDQDQRERLATARMLLKLNPGLRPRGMTKGTRIVVPFNNVTILPEKLAKVQRQQTARRSAEDQQQQLDANAQLERLPELLASGGYVELVQLAGRISASDLTEAQQVTLHRYLGQAFTALDRPDLAERAFSDLLELQPDFQFDQVTTSPTILEVLERARRGSQPNTTKAPVNRR